MPSGFLSPSVTNTTHVRGPFQPTYGPVVDAGAVHMFYSVKVGRSLTLNWKDWTACFRWARSWASCCCDLRPAIWIRSPIVAYRRVSHLGREGLESGVPVCWIQRQSFSMHTKHRCPWFFTTNLKRCCHRYYLSTLTPLRVLYLSNTAHIL